MIFPLSLRIRKLRVFLRCLQRSILIAAILPLLLPLYAQTSSPPAERITQDIQQEQQRIEAGKRSNLGPAQMGVFWSRLASDYQEQSNYLQAERSFNKALDLLDKAP